MAHQLNSSTLSAQSSWSSSNCSRKILGTFSTFACRFTLLAFCSFPIRLLSICEVHRSCCWVLLSSEYALVNIFGWLAFFPRLTMKSETFLYLTAGGLLTESWFFSSIPWFWCSLRPLSGLLLLQSLTSSACLPTSEAKPLPFLLSQGSSRSNASLRTSIHFIWVHSLWWWANRFYPLASTADLYSKADHATAHRSYWWITPFQSGTARLLPIFSSGLPSSHRKIVGPILCWRFH